MTDIAPEAAEPHSRTARFWGTWVVALVAALFLQIAGGAVTPPWASASAPPAAEAPTDSGTPVEPGAAAPAPTPTTPAMTDACAPPGSAYAKVICAAAAALGWKPTSTSPLREGETFTVLVDDLPPLATGQRLAQPDIQEGRVVTFYHQREGLMTAAIEPLPAQSTAAVADEIRKALGVPEIFFLDGDALVPGPSINYGPGWSIATKYDSARAVGDVVAVGSRTLTVTASAPEDGTFYRVN